MEREKDSIIYHPRRHSPVGIAVGRVDDERPAVVAAKLREEGKADVVHVGDGRLVQNGPIDYALGAHDG